jgi:hypothetical protein
MDTLTVSKHPRAPIVERVAGWSVRHRIVAVTGWLLFVAIAFALGQHLGTSNTTSYDPGQAGQAQRVLNAPGVQQPASESVLIQAWAGRPTRRSARTSGRQRSPRCQSRSRRCSSCSAR